MAAPDTDTRSGPVRLGRIGDHIARSRSPDLHRIAGDLCGIRVTYDLFIPQAMGRSFEDVFAACGREGMRGVNITYPYKERAAALVAVEEPGIRRIGSVNTVLFDHADG